MPPGTRDGDDADSMAAEVSIRPVVASDLDSVVELQTDSIMAAGVPFYGEAKARAWARLGFEFRHQLLGEGAFFVAERARRRGSELVGVGGWSPDGMEADLAWLRYLFVHPATFRRGIGGRLVATIEDSARASSRPRLRVWSSLNAVPFYQACGYRRRRSGRFPIRAGVELDYVLLSKGD